jgi:glycosyltransferase involved in cell wall biosynthesis
MKKHLVSVVIPVFNESKNIELLTQNLLQSKVRMNLEIIFVNDGSVDDTKEILERLTNELSEVRAIHFSRNFGQHAAIMAGLDKCSGDFAVVMDGDLQDSVELIQDLLTKCLAGWDVVFAERQNVNYSFLNQILQRVFYWILNSISDVKFNRRTGNFSIITRQVINEYKKLNGTILFYPAALRALGFYQSTIPYTRNNRSFSSRTKYPLRSRIRLALSVVAAHAGKLFRLAIISGVLLFFLFIAHFLFAILHGDLNLMILLLDFTLILLCFLIILIGFLGLFLGDQIHQNDARPRYFIHSYSQNFLCDHKK